MILCHSQGYLGHTVYEQHCISLWQIINTLEDFGANYAYWV